MLTPNPYDLFGDVPVTRFELIFWCKKIAPRISPARRDWYIKNYNVLEKVKAAKRDGSFYFIAS